MKLGILVGQKGTGNDYKILNGPMPFDEARDILNAHRLDSKLFKDYDSIWLQRFPVGAKSESKTVVVGRETLKARQAKLEEKPPAAEEKPEPVKKASAKASAIVAFALLVFGFAAQAQNATTLQLGATAITATSTNTAESAAYRWAADDILVMQATCTAADAGTSNVLFFLDTSLDGSSWKADQYTLTFACNGSNVANTVITRTTNTYGGLFWKVGGVGTDQTNTVTLSGVKYYLVE